MRYTYIKLVNYIGIYNGMGLYEIEIDLSKCTHRVCVIKGTNGSGKSTIMNALSIFPDGTSNFIPDKSASKVVKIFYNGLEYTIRFFHDMKPNGTRDTTKAYIGYTNENGDLIELNQNGNVQSYKTIVYDIFKLDPNFSALSKLSMDDRGIGYKRPAERKKFVNSIIESLDTYNDIYKTITKKANNIKVLMSSITSKLGAMGDKESISNLIEAIDKELSSLREDRDKCLSYMGELKASVDNLDPGGSIQQEYENCSSNLKAIESAIRDISKRYTNKPTLLFPEPYRDYLNGVIDTFSKEIEELEKQKIAISSEMKEVMKTYGDICEEQRVAQVQLSSVQTADYIDTKHQLKDAIARRDSIAETIKCTGINPNLFSKDEYILALQTVRDIINQVDIFRSVFDYGVITDAINAYRQTGYKHIPPLIDDSQHRRVIAKYEEYQWMYTSEKNRIQGLIDLASSMQYRPETCTDDNCHFISEVVKAYNANPWKMMDDLNRVYDMLKDKYALAKEFVSYSDEYNKCINSIRIIVRSMDTNGFILSRLPNGGIFSSKAEFFERLLAGESFEYVEKMYDYISLANYYEDYHVVCKQIDAYNSLLQSIKANIASISQLESSISSLQEKADKYTSRIEQLQKDLGDITDGISYRQNRIAQIRDKDLVYLDKIIDLFSQRDEFIEKQSELSDMMRKITSYTSVIKEKSLEVASLNMAIQLKQEDRSDNVHKIQQIDSYEKEMAEYEKQFNLLEKIKYYSSPTTGIQLVFMQLYMGNILTISNQLLSHLFGGTYTLQPFIINEAEFRIPCIGEGYLNEDISSMSSSQLTMISMILSFALLYTSSTEYNIIKLDEIDDPLDEVNRAAFAIMLDKIMDIMNTEQCIMISHSSELIMENTDLILLKTDGISSMPQNGTNVVWSY